MPITVAETVARPNRPLAAEIFSGRNSSGMIPIFEGEKSALSPHQATAVNKQTTLTIGRASIAIDHTPKAMMTISATLQPTMTSPLAETIRQIAGRRGQDQVGDHKACGAGHQDDADLRLVDVILANADRQPAEDVVVDGRQQLGDQQARGN